MRSRFFRQRGFHGEQLDVDVGEIQRRALGRELPDEGAPQSREIDYLEEADGRLSAWEIKSNPASRVKIPLAFLRAYPEAHTGILTSADYEEFLLPPAAKQSKSAKKR